MVSGHPSKSNATVWFISYQYSLGVGYDSLENGDRVSQTKRPNDSHFIILSAQNQLWLCAFKIIITGIRIRSLCKLGLQHCGCMPPPTSYVAVYLTVCISESVHKWVQVDICARCNDNSPLIRCACLLTVYYAAVSVRICSVWESIFWKWVYAYKDWFFHSCISVCVQHFRSPKTSSSQSASNHQQISETF